MGVRLIQVSLLYKSHYSQVEALFYEDKKYKKLLLLFHVLFLLNISDDKVITAMPLNYIFPSVLLQDLFLRFFLMQIIEITRTLTL